MNTQQPEDPRPVGPPPPVAPLGASRYTNFYLTLLILSTIGTAVSLLGFATLRETIDYFDTALGYSLVQLFSYFVIVPVSIVALILLWHKHHAGIWVKLGAYAASIATTIALFFVSGPVLERTLEEAVEQNKADGSPISDAAIEAITSGVYYAAIAFSIIGSILFATLWWFAWKKQIASDEK